MSELWRVQLLYELRRAVGTVAAAPFVDLLEHLLDGVQRIVGIRFEATDDLRIVGRSQAAGEDEVLFVNSRLQPVFADAQFLQAACRILPARLLGQGLRVGAGILCEFCGSPCSPTGFGAFSLRRNRWSPDSAAPLGRKLQRLIDCRTRSIVLRLTVLQWAGLHLIGA